MTEPVRFALANSALPGTRETLGEDPRGWVGETVQYGTRGASVETRVVVMAKLPASAVGDRRGITATGDSDVAAYAINNLFDAASFRSPREPWKADLDRYLANYLGFDAWSATTIQVDGASQNAFSLHYADVAVHVADVGDVYLIVVTVPLVEMPSVQRI
jgi:hypothetical protein